MTSASAAAPNARTVPATGLVAAARALSAMGLIPRRRFAAVMAISVVAIGLESVGVAMLKPILDFIQAGGDIATLKTGSGIWRHIVAVYGWLDLDVTLLVLCLTVFGLIVLRQLTAYFSLVWRIQLRHDIGRKMSVRLFRQLLACRSTHIQDFGQGSFVYLLGTQVQAANALMNSFGQLWNIVLTMAAYGAVILVVAPLTSLVAFAVLGLAVASVSRYVRHSRSASRRLVRSGEVWTRFVTDRYRSWRLVKFGDSLEREVRRARGYTDEIYARSVGLARLEGRIEGIIAPLIVFAVLAGLYVSATYFAFSVSLITLFVVIVMRLMPVAQNLAKLRQSVSVQLANLDRVMQAFREAEEEREVDTGTVAFTGAFDRIAFEDVSFSYAGGKLSALSHVTVSIPAGKLTAIIGPSGAGKSTFVDLLPRLLTPTGGTIRLGGIPLGEYSLRSLRRNIAYVPQEPLIFDDTVLENVRYLREDATRDEVKEACRLAFADRFVEDMPDGYDTMLTENGARLSGGQRQRLVLARAFLARPSILILDEPTSALDYQSEIEIHRAIDTLIEQFGTTVIVIAHRLSTVRHAAFLLVLQEGRLVECGAPGSLSRSDSWYARMLALDSAGGREVARLSAEPASLEPARKSAEAS